MFDDQTIENLTGFPRNSKMMNEPTIEKSIADTETAENETHELREPRWAVISFDRSEAQNLTYAEAERKLEELTAQKVSGLCIVPDETAAKIR